MFNAPAQTVYSMVCFHCCLMMLNFARFRNCLRMLLAAVLPVDPAFLSRERRS
jgi:hypothetical protein